MADLPMASPSSAPILLPEDPAVADLLDHGKDRFLDVVAAHPDSCLVWAILAEGSLAQRDRNSDVSGYAFARTGYHRGLDALRRAGWRGSGAVPWSHTPNQGFLRALWALAVAARADVACCALPHGESAPIVAALRARGLPTLPSTIAMERAINPFLRSRERAVVTSDLGLTWFQPSRGAEIVGKPRPARVSRYEPRRLPRASLTKRG